MREKEEEGREDDPAAAVLALCRIAGVELQRRPGMDA
jgi:hypothetical protein